MHKHAQCETQCTSTMQSFGAFWVSVHVRQSLRLSHLLYTAYTWVLHCGFSSFAAFHLHGTYFNNLAAFNPTLCPCLNFLVMNWTLPREACYYSSPPPQIVQHGLTGVTPVGSVVHSMMRHCTEPALDLLVLLPEIIHFLYNLEGVPSIWPRGFVTGLVSLCDIPSCIYLSWLWNYVTWPYSVSFRGNLCFKVIWCGWFTLHVFRKAFNCKCTV